MKKILKGLMMLLIMCVFIGVGRTDTYAAKGYDGFDMEIKTGLDSVVLPYQVTPVEIEFTNVSKDFTGTVELEILDNMYDDSDDYYYYEDADSWTYEQAVTIAKGEDKSVTFFTDAFEGSAGAKITVKDSKGKILYSESKYVPTTSPDYYYMGILSDDYQALSYFNNSRTEHSISNIELTADDIYENENALDALSILLINNYNIEQLNDGQILGIERWVENGGVLIIGTGANGKKAFSSFEEISNNFTLEDLKKRNICTITDKVLTSDSYLVKTKDNTSETIAAIKYGNGNVIVAGYDFEQEEIVNYFKSDINGSKAISLYLSSVIEVGMINEDIDESYDIYGGYTGDVGIDKELYFDYVQNTEHKLSVWPYIFVIGGYIVLVLPILFFILKKKDKAQYSYFVMMGIGVVFAVLVFLLGSSTRIKEPFVQYLNLVNEDEYGNISNDLTIGIQTCDYDGYVGQFDDSFNISKPNAETYWYGNRADIKLKTLTGKTELSLSNLEPFSNRMFDTSYVSKNVPRIEAEIYMVDGALEGRITNTSDVDIEDLIVMQGESFNFALYAPLVRAGKSIDVSKLEYFSYRDLYEHKGLISDNTNMVMSRRYNLLEYYYSYGVYETNDINILYFTKDEVEDIYITEDESIYGLTMYKKKTALYDKESGKQIKLTSLYPEAINDMKMWSEGSDTIWIDTSSSIIDIYYDIEEGMETFIFSNKESEYYYDVKFTGKVYLYKGDKQLDVTDWFITEKEVKRSEIEEYIDNGRLYFRYESDKTLTDYTSVKIYSVQGKEIME